ncbi:UDP-2,4-diacetamido-2,4,6-trideoxy-beta-L-altropyranose hydrolase [Clostridium tarantellae]|uniref:UDP-2,4-diacetamido-2,4, 6-trideoxy-beta-L-altropyranose hydrolase n=1 Tax=Clostridium tarantellae TaxID=39493 RepID=A0A6I1MM35_9CLOT|nr:UDP-2,4-diacetamido-2,4,6-trideoxy-beta-L-altropyranose hydrolase [Clostridium tarantellae]MPQ43177.1 UDP-2,4-diacetamido-2,4,6-trideoxy-beta-L-altropyranose hydrolase [Clostridium tarantellae]
MKKIAIRVDGGKSIGLGHVMRCMVLGKELSKNNEILFICKNDSLNYKEGVEKLIANNLKVLLIDKNKDETNEIIDIQNNIKADLLIVDSYNINEEYFNKLRPHFQFVSYIFDIDVGKINVDFIINYNVNSEKWKYNNLCPNVKNLFLGCKYALIREEFRRVNKKYNKKVKNLLITTGGVDINKNTLKIAELFRNEKVLIHVAIGQAFDENLKKDLRALSKNSNNIKIYEDFKMSQLMSKCDLAISTCGVTLYELAAVGVPTIGIVVAENQLDICKEMYRQHAIISTGTLVSKDLELFKKIVESLMNNYEQRMLMVSNQKALINKNGVCELVKDLESVL